MKSWFLCRQAMMVAGVLIISLSSCKKFLDEKPNASQSVPSTLDELQNVFNDFERMTIGLTPSMPESSADDYFVMQQTYDYQPERYRQVYTWTLQEYNYANDWSSSYLPVYNSNFVLEGLQRIQRKPENEQQWYTVYGYAQFYKAYCFLNLLLSHAKAYDPATADKDLGIVLREGSDFNKPSKRASVQECYDKIISCLMEAAPVLQPVPGHGTWPSKAACYALLARTYLNMAKYDSAYKYSNLCLGIKSDLLDYNELPLTADVPFPGWDSPEVIFYTEMNSWFTLHYSFSGFVDSTLVASYEDGDLRKAGFFAPANGYHRFKGSYSTFLYSLFTGLATDEMYLTRAESLARLNKVSEAMEGLNTLMKTRWDKTMPYPEFTATDKETALNHILTERRKQLLMRGIRWGDLKRLNKEGRGITLTRKINGQVYNLAPNDKYYALPLPTDIIRLSGMEQN